MTADEQIAIPILIEQEFKRLLRAYLAKIKLELEERNQATGYDPFANFIRWRDIEEVFAQYEHD